MFNWFKKKPAVVEQTTLSKLQEQSITTQVTTVAVKNEFYHEIVPVKTKFYVRLYNRKTSALVEDKLVDSKDEAMELALTLLSTYNKGVA